jgi:hypothetical protein
MGVVSFLSRSSLASEEVPIIHCIHCPEGPLRSAEKMTSFLWN